MGPWGATWLHLKLWPMGSLPSLVSIRATWYKMWQEWKNTDQSQSSCNPINNGPKVRQFELLWISTWRYPVSHHDWDASQGPFLGDSMIVYWQFNVASMINCWSFYEDWKPNFGQLVIVIWWRWTQKSEQFIILMKGKLQWQANVYVPFDFRTAFSIYLSACVCVSQFTIFVKVCVSVKKSCCKFSMTLVAIFDQL